MSITKFEKAANHFLEGKKLIQTAMHNIGLSVKPWRNLGEEDWTQGTDSYETWESINSLLLGASVQTVSDLEVITNTEYTDYGTIEYDKETSPLPDKWKAAGNSIKAIKLNLANTLRSIGYTKANCGYDVYPLSSSDTTFESWQSYANKIEKSEATKSFVFQITIDPTQTSTNPNWRRTLFVPASDIIWTNSYYVIRTLLMYLTPNLYDSVKEEVWDNETSYAYTYSSAYTINWDVEGLTQQDEGYSTEDTEFTFSKSQDCFATDCPNGNAVYFTYPEVDEARTYTISITGTIKNLRFDAESSENFYPRDSSSSFYEDENGDTLAYKYANTNISNMKVLAWGNLNSTSFNNAFNQVTNLTDIPVVSSDVSGFAAVTTFNYAFRQCYGLTALPYDYDKKVSLFDGASNATNYNNCFNYCYNLTGTLPEGFFAGSPKASSFSGCFSNTKITKVEAGCFKNNTAVTSLSSVFGDITTLETIPEDMCEGCTALANVAGMFSGCTSLKGCTKSGDSTIYPISADLFRDCKVTKLPHLFQNCSSLIGVESDFFNNSIYSGATYINVDRIFYNCSSMTEAPLNIIPIFNNLTYSGKILTAAHMYDGTTSLPEKTIHYFYTDYTDGTVLVEPTFETSQYTIATRGMFYNCPWISGASNLLNAFSIDESNLSDDDIEKVILNNLWGIYGFNNSVTGLRYEQTFNDSNSSITKVGMVYDGSTFTRPTYDTIRNYKSLVIHEDTARYTLLNIDCPTSGHSKTQVGISGNVLSAFTTYSPASYEDDWCDWWYPFTSGLNIRQCPDTNLFNISSSWDQTEKYVDNDVHQDAKRIAHLMDLDDSTYGFKNYPKDYPCFYKAKVLNALSLNWYVIDSYHGYYFMNKYPYFQTLFSNIFPNKPSASTGQLPTFGINCCEEISSTMRATTNAWTWNDTDIAQHCIDGRDKSFVGITGNPGERNAAFVTFVYKDLEFYDWIKSDGASYIDVGVFGSDDLDITYIGSVLESSKQQRLFSIYAGETCTDGTIEVYQNGNNQYAFSHINSSWETSGVGVASLLGKKLTFEMNIKDSYVSLSSTDATLYYASASAYTAFDEIETMRLFSRSNGYYYANAICYNFRIAKGGVLIRNMYPCKYNGVVGMWDKVNDRFYPNLGTGTFTVGND